MFLIFIYLEFSFDNYFSQRKRLTNLYNEKSWQEKKTFKSMQFE